MSKWLPTKGISGNYDKNFKTYTPTFSKNIFYTFILLIII